MKKIVFILLVTVGFYSCTPENPEIMQIVDDFSNVDVEILFENDKENGINVIFMGDAYLKADLNRENGIYRRQAVENINTLFSTHPFSEYKEHFNAYIVYVESEENVIDFDAPSSTAFGSTSGSCVLGIRCLVITHQFQVDFYMRAVKQRNQTPRDLILMSVNNAHGGSAGIGSGIAVFGSGNANVMVHEVGHAFSRLADEYELGGTNPLPNTNWSANLDQIGILGKVKWKHFIDLDDYEEVGAFEGGGYVQEGIWRPEEFSVMRSTSFLRFNAPSRESIVKRILELRGIPYSFEDFLEIDRANMDRISLHKDFDLQPNLCGVISVK
jgi:hypothetical protein